MRVLVQRVCQARVLVDDTLVAAIDQGLLVFVCAMDEQKFDVKAWAERLCNLRVFADTEGRMNLSTKAVGGSLLLVPQFTLSADMNKGLRPSFGRASSPTLAAQQIDQLAQACRAQGINVACGRFGADMAVELTNDGPVTLFIDKP
jgi:D-tyrosyl-tRNA(Tyr) deacylase